MKFHLKKIKGRVQKNKRGLSRVESGEKLGQTMGGNEYPYFKLDKVGCHQAAYWWPAGIFCLAYTVFTIFLRLVANGDNATVLI